MATKLEGATGSAVGPTGAISLRPAAPSAEALLSERGRRRLRIAMVAACPFPYPRGTPVRAFRMAEALGNRGHDVHVITYHVGDAAPDAPFRIHRTPHLPTYRRTAPGPTLQKLVLLDTLLYRTLRRVMGEHEFDVIHAHHYEGLLVARALPAEGRPPIVYDAHTLLSSELPYYPLGMTRKLKSAIGLWLDRRAPRAAAHVIGVTEVLRERLVSIGAVPPERITVIGSGVELSLFAEPAEQRARALETLIFTGNLASYQGIEYLLEAFSNVRRQRPGCRLQIVTGSPFTEYEALARSLGVREHIDILNVGLKDLPGLLQYATVAINPRVYCEGIPQKMMNYMASGCAIVSFAGSAAHLRHESTGLVVPDGDVNAMAAGVLRLMTDTSLAERLGGAARQQIVQHYSWERVAEHTEAVYGRVMAEPPLDG